MDHTEDEPLIAQPVPSSDRVFAGVVREAARSAASPGDLARRLQPLYPNVRLSERTLSSEPRVYYVYRDGSFVPDPADSWWEDPLTPYVELAADTGRITKANGSWAELMEAPPEQLLGRHYTDFLLPEAQEAAGVLFASLLASAEVRSRLLLRRPDGSVVAVEFRAVCDLNVCRVHYRPIER
jgi:PAS domain-containing protein